MGAFDRSHFAKTTAHSLCTTDAITNLFSDHYSASAHHVGHVDLRVLGRGVQNNVDGLEHLR